MENATFTNRLEAVEKELKSLMESPEYCQMLKSSYTSRCDVTLADAVLAIQECFNEYQVAEVFEN